jgi:hypothetical protein
MVKEITFQLDIQAASPILTDMARQTVQNSADAVAGRAASMLASVSKDPADVNVSTVVGTVPRGRGKRAIATVTASSARIKHGQLLEVLVKSKDAGRI